MKSILAVLVIAVASTGLSACAPIDCDPENPCYDVDTVTFHTSPVATTTDAGRFVAWGEERDKIRGHLLGSPIEALGDGVPVALASDGVDHLLLARQGDALVARIVPGGATHVIAHGVGDVELMFDGDGYTVAWVTSHTGFVARLSRDGAPSVGPWQVTATETMHGALSLAVDPVGAAVAWVETPVVVDPQGVHHTGPGQLHLRRVGFDGTLGDVRVMGQANDAAIAGDARGLVVASLTENQQIIVDRLDAAWQPLAASQVVATSKDIGAGGFGVDIAGTIDRFVVRYRYPPSLGAEPTTRAVVFDGVLGIHVTLSSSPVITAHGGVFHAVWVDHRFEDDGSGGYLELYDLKQATLRTDGMTTELLD